MESVANTIIGGLIGLIAGLLIPWVRWEVDRRRQEHQRRVELIQSCRGMVRIFSLRDQPQPESAYSFREYLEKQTEYYAIKPHLSAEFIRKLEAPRTVYVAADGDSLGALVQMFIGELSVVEKRWNLI